MGFALTAPVPVRQSFQSPRPTWKPRGGNVEFVGSFGDFLENLIILNDLEGMHVDTIGYKFVYIWKK